MKNIKKALLLGVAFLGVGAITACNNNNSGNNGQQEVENDAVTAVNKILLNQDKGTVTADFEVASTVKFKGTAYNVTWKADKDVVSFETANGKTTAKVNYLGNNQAEQKVQLTATVTIGDNIANKVFEVTVPKFTLNSIAEYDAADADALLTIRGVITARGIYNATAKTCDVYLQAIDGNGGFEAYTMSCASQDKYDNELAVGNTIYVTGKKSDYYGLRELKSPQYIFDSNEAKKTLTPVDLTSTIADKTFTTLANKQCHLVEFKDVEIVSISTPDSTGQYSIVVGDESDKTKQATVRISKYVVGEKTATDYAFKELKLVPAQKITVRGILGWYNSDKENARATGAQLTVLPDGITAGEVNYGKAVASTAANDLTAAVGAKCIPNKVVTLKTALKDLGLTGDNYKDFTIEYTTESEVASIANGKLTNTKPEADTDVTVVITVKKGTEVAATKNVTYKLLKEVTYTAHADYIDAKDKTEINVKGYVLEVSADKKTVFLQDDNGNTFYCYLSKALTATQAKVGYQLGITGSMTTYSGLREVGSAVVVEDLGQTNKALTYVNKTEDFTAKGYTTLDKYDQCKAVTFTGVVKSVDGRNIVVTVGEKEIKVYLNNTSIVLTYPKAGDNVTIKGLLGLYEKDNNKTYQILVNNADNFIVSVSDEEKATRELAGLEATIGTALFDEEKEISLATRFAGATFTVTPATGATTLSYDATKKVLKVTPGETEVTEKVTIAVTVGEQTKSKEIDVKSKEAEGVYKLYNAVTAEVKGSVATTATYGLDPAVFTVTYDKNGATDMAIRTDGIRMYATNSTTDGNKLTVTIASGKKIDKIKIAFDSASYGKTAKILDKDGKEIKANADGSYTINGSSFTIYNDNSGVTSNSQVRFQSIKIYTSEVSQA